MAILRHNRRSSVFLVTGFNDSLSKLIEDIGLY